MAEPGEFAVKSVVILRVSWPHHLTTPDSSGSSPASARSRLLFPEPLAPLTCRQLACIKGEAQIAQHMHLARHRCSASAWSDRWALGIMVRTAGIEPTLPFEEADFPTTSAFAAAAWRRSWSGLSLRRGP